jgi:hypothetical protein
MIDQYRKLFNAQFTDKKYQEFKDDIAADFDYLPTFRLGKLLFISKDLKNQIIEGSNQVIAFIQSNNFKALTDKSLELNHNVPNEDEHTTFLAIDFGICEEDGEIIPN